MCSVIRASVSIAATSRDGSAPNSASGDGSGVTRCSSASTPIESARSPSISASSYSGSGQVLPAGTTNASSPQVAAFDVLDDAVQTLLVGDRARERGRARERLDRPRARGDEQHVVGQPLGLSTVVTVWAAGVDRGEPAAHVREAGVGGHPLRADRPACVPAANGASTLSGR